MENTITTTDFINDEIQDSNKVKTFLEIIFQLQNELRVLHWSTDKYSEHIAFGNLYDSLNPLFHDFVEAYIGQVGKDILTSIQQYSITLYGYDQVMVQNYLLQLIEHLSNIENTLIGNIGINSNLLNIRDEMIQEIRKTIYLLTLS